MLDFSVTFIITIINIIVLFFILRAILWKPVTKFMENRARRIQESIEQSDKDKADAQALLAQYQEQLKTAKTEAEAIIRGAREQAQVEADKIISDSRISAESILANARKQLETEQSAALATFRQEAASLVVTATGQLIKREIKTEDSKSYAEMLLEEAGKY